MKSSKTGSREHTGPASGPGHLSCPRFVLTVEERPCGFDHSRLLLAGHGLPHVPFGGVQKGGPFSFEMTLAPYTKPHAFALERIAHLRTRGLTIPRPNVAARKIELIGYERLRIYFLSRRQLTAPGRPFNPNTSYKDIIRLYECDMLLRDACFSAVGQVEILLRNSISEKLSHSYGSHPYFIIGAFRNAASNLETIRTFASVYQKSKDHRAKHYRDTYSNPVMPPIWTMKEFLTFGTASRVLQSLSGPLRTAISADFGIGKDTIFTSWVECFVDLRNIRAHHDRLFNRSFQKQPSTLASAGIPTAPKQKLKAVLECLDHVLHRRGAQMNITSKVEAIINRYPEMKRAEAGF